jgi:D-beta-D-heptose 7-phosphate kinase/D-beta-D-heptose 1-phosphate adenosyltransferase
VTRGEHGMSLIRKNNRPFHLATHAREVFDVTGAGDTVIATFAASLAVGKDMQEATQI